MNKQHYLLLICLCISTPAVAGQTVYRCGEVGHYIFSTEPCNDQPTAIQIESTRLSTDPNPYQAMSDAYKKDLKLRSEARATHKPAPKRRGPAKTNGLSLSDFNRIDIGMSEGEVLLRLGHPDRESIDSVNTELGITRKSFYYIKKGFNSNVSRLLFSNGNLVDKRRELIKNP